MEELYDAGWRRFKLPIAADWDATVARLAAARAVADDLWLGMDANWVFRSAEEVGRFSECIEHLDVGWIEDVVPPGDATLVARARSASRVPIAMGDEQGGAYHPDALLAEESVDVIRIDVTTTGGITRLAAILQRVRASGAAFSCHMFLHVTRKSSRRSA